MAFLVVRALFPRALFEGEPTSLLVVIVATGVFTVLALLAAVVAMSLHLRRRFWARWVRRREAKWRPLMLDGLSGEASPRALVDLVAARERDAFLSFLIPYATAIEGEDEQFIRAVARPFLKSVRASLSSNWPMERAQALRRLGLLGGSMFTDALRDALGDPSLIVKLTALRWLARRGEPEDARVILNRLNRLSKVDRRQVSSALVESGEEAAPIFREGLMDDSRSVFVRVVCAETLRWLGDGASADVAASMLETGRLDPELAAGLLRLLRRIGRRPHARIARRYCEAGVAFVRIHAARALGQIGAPDDEALLATLVQSDEARWVALSAARSLIELDRPRAIQHLRGSDHPRASLAQGVLPRTA